ncbi:MAG: hypothetical protein H7287_01030 [Thermoleophilia bacterium]|nr:hypothetical protein [Thermoleophilia bacterium]
MTTDTRFEFVLHAQSRRGDGEAVLDELYAAGVIDGLVQVDGHDLVIELERRAASLFAAVVSALRQVESVDGCRVIRAGRDDVVSLAEIGRRTGITRESARLLATGRRGPGGFPLPLANIKSQQAWSWGEVSAWLRETGRLDEAAAGDTQVMRVVNAALEARNAVRGVQDAVVRKAARSMFVDLLEVG